MIAVYEIYFLCEVMKSKMSRITRLYVEDHKDNCKFFMLVVRFEKGRVWQSLLYKCHISLLYRGFI